MARYAVINNGTCENLIECDASEADASWILITDSNAEQAGVGASYDSATDTFGDVVVSYTPEELTEMAEQALIDSDWTQLPDVGLTADSVLNWRTYRATLREIKDGDKGWSDWPDQPAKEYV